MQELAAQALSCSLSRLADELYLAPGTAKSGNLFIWPSFPKDAIGRSPLTRFLQTVPIRKRDAWSYIDVWDLGQTSIFASLATARSQLPSACCQ